MQHIDVTVDGRPFLVNQRSDRDRVWERIRTRAQTAEHLCIDRHAPPPPVHTPGGVNALQRTIFWGPVSDDAIAYAEKLTGWRHALSADSGEPVSIEQVGRLKKVGPVDAWGNQLQIGSEAVEHFAQVHDLDRRIGQAENPTEAALLTLPYAIGNFTRDGLGNMFEPLMMRVTAGHLNVTTEVYNGHPETYDTNGFPADSFTLGVALDGGHRWPLSYLIDKMKNATPPIPTNGVCIWHGAGLALDDWEVLATL